MLVSIAVYHHTTMDSNINIYVGCIAMTCLILFICYLCSRTRRANRIIGQVADVRAVTVSLDD